MERFLRRNAVLRKAAATKKGWIVIVKTPPLRMGD